MKRTRRIDDLPCFAVDKFKMRSQGFVPLQQRRKGALERLNIQDAAETQCERNVIRLPGESGSVEKEQSLLGIRQGQLAEPFFVLREWRACVGATRGE